MKLPILIAVVAGITIGAGATLAFRSDTGNPSVVQSNRNTADLPNPGNTNLPMATVRGPYPVDDQGCTVIDLRGMQASQHDPAAKTYAWLVEHPAEADCLRQTNPVIAETVVESTNEKILGTNVWKLTFRYE